jgi:hypothetical protein
MSRYKNVNIFTQEKMLDAARKLREADATEKQEQAIMLAFCDQMAWGATTEALQEAYGIDPTLVTASGKSRWTNHGVFEGPVTIAGLRLETRVVLERVEDDERILGYRTDRSVRLVRRDLLGRERPVSRLNIAEHLEKASRSTRSK